MWDTTRNRTVLDLSKFRIFWLVLVGIRGLRLERGSGETYLKDRIADAVHKEIPTVKDRSHDVLTSEIPEKNIQR